MTRQATALEAWVRLLRAHAKTTRAISAQLSAEHGLTINDFEALLHLARAEGRRMKRVELADGLLLTPSGVTRLLEGLERAGYVAKASCESDARVTYAVLTDEGLRTAEQASASHAAAVAELFGERFEEDELGTLADLLGRLPGVTDGASGEECRT